MKIPPINVLYLYMQKKCKVQVWLYEQRSTIHGQISGFDEFMNLVLKDAVLEEVDGSKREIGEMMIKGDCISLVSTLN